MTRGVLGALVGRLGFLFTAIAVPSVFATISKRLIGRARPYVGAHDDPFIFMPFIWRPEFASMPSGHATTAAAAAIAFGAIWPRLRVALWLYAVSYTHLDVYKRQMLACVAALAAFAGWIAALGPAPLGTEVVFSTRVVDRDGRLLRAYATGEGRWRLPARIADVDPRFFDLLLAYEDKRLSLIHI